MSAQKPFLHTGCGGCGEFGVCADIGKASRSLSAARGAASPRCAPHSKAELRLSPGPAEQVGAVPLLDTAAPVGAVK